MENEVRKALEGQVEWAGRGEKNPVGEGHVRQILRMIKEDRAGYRKEQDAQSVRGWKGAKGTINRGTPGIC